ncbi:MAG: phosphatase PAP2 family protein [Planctomycetes bacterium]|nr:phosphatase PAP2 family protein [Planctomycetota bacterium]
MADDRTHSGNLRDGWARLKAWLDRHSWWPAIALVVLLGALWVFLETADEVFEGELEAAERKIMLAFRAPGDVKDPVGPPWFEEMMRDFTALGSAGVLTLVSLAVLGYLLLIRRGAMAALLVVAVGGAMALSLLLKAGFGRPRPDVVAYEMDVYTLSFPSGHAMMATAVYLTLAVLLARVQTGHLVRVYLLAVAAVFVFVVGASRVYLGVHWPTDVLAGWTAGTVWALLCWLAAEAVAHRRRARRRAGDSARR